MGFVFRMQLHMSIKIDTPGANDAMFDKNCLELISGGVIKFDIRWGINQIP